MSDLYHYEYEQDEFYCYHKSHTLKNKLNIIDEEKLKQAEREITALRTAQLMKNPIKGKFDFNHIKKIHVFLFGDIYEWAGKVRIVNISKGNQFCLCQYIDSQMEDVLNKLKKEKYLEGLDIVNMSKRLSYYLGEINAIHPFREGNGRTQRMFIQELSEYNGYRLDWSKIKDEEMLEASVQSFNLKYELMEELVLRALSSK
ncbi:MULTISPECIES: Fic/DOC family protein [Clostridium]|uniref:protein adenylyltransferase n=1 Tax=Clostridium intestinale DSM 6191 TaxID=1121320 RepID=A0A1M6DXX9_9CLOT|nr:MULTISPECIES: Fic family protein [Clostridium]SHI77989.1 cell filamentation protein [Clostridium intestinale DSM 6191]